MKDRIRTVMEMQHMTQQVFAGFIGLSPATLSSILTGRTNPTLPIVYAIKKKIPDISTDWLMFGTGEMFASDEKDAASATPAQPLDKGGEPLLDFGADEAQAEVMPASAKRKSPAQDERIAIVKNIDKTQRKITEIRIFYDDQTWETFLPKQ